MVVLKKKYICEANIFFISSIDMITDPIADLLTRIRNAIHAGHRSLEVKSSRMRKSIVEVLYDKGYIQGYKVVERGGPQGYLQIGLKYNPLTKESAIRELGRLSKPSLRRYSSVAKLPHVYNGLGIAIVSTSRGVMSDKEARRMNVGGEVLCYVF